MAAPRVDCEHWSECGPAHAGCCAKGLFGGAPSRGTCNLACKDRESRDPQAAPPKPIPLTVRRAAHGVAGIAKALTGTGGATAETIAARTALCGTCEYAELVGGKLQRCKLCGCGTWPKVRLASESCPLNKWGPQPPP